MIVNSKLPSVLEALARQKTRLIYRSPGFVALHKIFPSRVRLERQHTFTHIPTPSYRAARWLAEILLHVTWHVRLCLAIVLRIDYIQGLLGIVAYLLDGRAA